MTGNRIRNIHFNCSCTQSVFIFSDLPVTQSSNHKFAVNKILSRRPSLTIDKSVIEDEDAFEHILQVTAHHEAIMAYYYLDDNNKVC